MSNPWYTYPQDKPPGVYGSYPDPLGPYPKPDTNVCVPTGVPITALASGTVTGVNPHCQWCPSVTIKLDQPLNNIADHMAYNFLGSTTVSNGDKVQKGQIIGYAGSPSGICTAFALTHDDMYGNGTFSQYVGSPSLDPRGVLASAIAGLPITPFTSNGSTGATGGILTGITSTITALLKDAAVFILALLLIIIGVVLLKDTASSDVGVQK
jgi:hypothetical protein